MLSLHAASTVFSTIFHWLTNRPARRHRHAPLRYFRMPYIYKFHVAAIMHSFTKSQQNTGIQPCTQPPAAACNFPFHTPLHQPEGFVFFCNFPPARPARIGLFIGQPLGQHDSTHSALSVLSIPMIDRPSCCPNRTTDNSQMLGFWGEEH